MEKVQICSAGGAGGSHPDASSGFLHEALVKVGNVGCQVIACRDVHVGVERITPEVDGAAISNLEIFVDDLLQAEVVVPFGNLHISIHAQVALRAILDL